MAKPEREHGETVHLTLARDTTAAADAERERPVGGRVGDGRDSNAVRFAAWRTHRRVQHQVTAARRPTCLRLPTMPNRTTARHAVGYSGINGSRAEALASSRRAAPGGSGPAGPPASLRSFDRCARTSTRESGRRPSRRAPRGSAVRPARDDKEFGVEEPSGCRDQRQQLVALRRRGRALEPATAASENRRTKCAAQDQVVMREMNSRLGAADYARRRPTAATDRHVGVSETQGRHQRHQRSQVGDMSTSM